jgi:flavin-dependent dehydrogenase
VKGTRYDLIVVGGGPAGLATALHAARAGWSVAVCEPRPAPVDKACGEGLMPPAVRALAGLGVRPDGHRFPGVAYVRGHRRVEGLFRGGATGLGVARARLHAGLHAAALAAGVDVLPVRVTGIRPDGRGVAAAGLRARWLVAADGLHSPTRRALGLDAPRRGPARYGLRAHWAVRPWSPCVEVHFGADSEAYVTPLGERLVGVAVLTRWRGSYAERLAAFPELAARLHGHDPAGPVRGAGPMRRRATARRRGPVLLVGDAAGYVDALTGEGLAQALASAEAAVACLVRGRPQDYDAAWLRVTRRQRLLTHALLTARHLPGAGRLLVPAADRMPRVFTAAVNALAR